MRKSYSLGSVEAYGETLLVVRGLMVAFVTSQSLFLPFWIRFA